MQYRKPIILISLCAMLLPLWACNKVINSVAGISDSTNAPPVTGQVSINIQWPGTATPPIQTMAFPKRTYSIYIMVTASDIATSVNTTVIYPSTTASLSVPVGTNRKFWAIAKDTSGVIVASGSSAGNTITSGVTNQVSIPLTAVGETSGQVSLFAGGGGSTSADGIGSAAGIAKSYSIVSDSLGNLYFTEGTTVRKITPQGVVSTIGTGYESVSRLYIDAQDNVYFCDYSYSYSSYARIYKYSGGSITQVFSETDTGNYPYDSEPGEGLVKDSNDNYYLAGYAGRIIYKYTKTGITWVRTTYAGDRNSSGFVNGLSARFNAMSDIAIDNSGNLFVADELNNAIRKVATDGTVSTFYNYITTPHGIWIDGDNNFYVACDFKVVKISSDGGQITTIAGQATSGYVNDVGVLAKFNTPADVCKAPDGSLFVTDHYNYRIRRIAP